MKKRWNKPGYAILISLILLVLSTGVIVFEFQYQRQQLRVNRELMQKLEYQIKQNLNKSDDDSKENVHNFQNE